MSLLTTEHEMRRASRSNSLSLGAAAGGGGGGSGGLSAQHRAVSPRTRATMLQHEEENHKRMQRSVSMQIMDRPIKHEEVDELRELISTHLRKPDDWSSVAK